MEFKDVMAKLEAAGSEQTRKTYTRHGVKGPMFGVKHGDLKPLQKAIKKDHGLARELWDSGNYDARVLATMVADPALMDAGLLEAWLRQVDNAPLSDMFVDLVARTPLIEPMMEMWKHSDVELVQKVYWNLVARRAMGRNGLDDSAFTPYLDEIETTLHERPDRIRHAMNNALIAIGVRSPRLEKRARAVAKAIGKVEVDHGDTSCKTPDATAYIERTLAKKGHLFASEPAKSGAKKGDA